jgi:cytochrome c biogenesis protein CcmG/thiol:disulfide interchange protein DsbE
MKKTLLIVVTVLLLIAATIYADKATRVSVKSANSFSSVGLPAGTPAPPLVLKDLDDKDVPLAGLKGKVVFVNFWATWCEPCRIETPQLITLQNKYADKGFTILGIAMDEEGKSVVAPFVAKQRYDVAGQQLPMNYPIVIGNDAAADKFGGIFGYPTNYLVSREGKIVKRFQGVTSDDALTKAIESQL